MTLDDGIVSLERCANLASARGFKGFIWTDMAHPAASSSDDSAGGDSSIANCFTHEVDGRMPQYEQGSQMTPSEKTCNDVPDYGASNPSAYKGWARADTHLSPGNGEVTSHYAVVSSSECPKPWSWEYKNNIFGLDGPEAYFPKPETRGVGSS